jgi:hypothetical protein
MLTLALRAPDSLGLKVTVIVQFAPTPRLLGQVLVCEKSPGLDPATTILLMLMLAVPLLVSVAVCEPLLVPSG